MSSSREPINVASVASRNSRLPTNSLRVDMFIIN